MLKLFLLVTLFISHTFAKEIFFIEVFDYQAVQGYDLIITEGPTNILLVDKESRWQGKVVGFLKTMRQKLYFSDECKDSVFKVQNECVQFKKPSGHYQTLFLDQVLPLQSGGALVTAKFLTESFPPSQFRVSLSSKGLNLVLWESRRELYSIESMTKFMKEITGQLKVVDRKGKKRTIRERGGISGRIYTREHMDRIFKSLGYATEYNSFSGGKNLVATKKGSIAKKYIYVTAHYDSKGNKGADDNGSGVTAMISIAKAMQGLNLEYGVRFVGFDMEEEGLTGSKRYVGSMGLKNRLEEIVAVINLDMIGYDSDNDGRFMISHCDLGDSAKLGNMLESTISNIQTDLTPVIECMARSDQVSFWRHSIPAILVIEMRKGKDTQDCYHKACDTIELINFNYLKKITDATLALMLSLTGATQHERDVE